MLFAVFYILQMQHIGTNNPIGALTATDPVNPSTEQSTEFSPANSEEDLTEPSILMDQNELLAQLLNIRYQLELRGDTESIEHIGCIIQNQLDVIPID